MARCAKGEAWMDLEAESTTRGVAAMSAQPYSCDEEELQRRLYTMIRTHHLAHIATCPECQEGVFGELSSRIPDQPSSTTQ